MQHKVIDASVLAAFLFGEPRQEEAKNLIENSELFAPTLLSYELSNVAKLKINKYPEQKESLKSALDVGLQLSELNLVKMDGKKVLQTALEYNLSSYDASYLLLADLLSLPLITFDDKLKKAFNG